MHGELWEVLDAGDGPLAAVTRASWLAKGDLHKDATQITLMSQMLKSPKMKTRHRQKDWSTSTISYCLYLVCCKARGEGTFTMCTDTDGELGFRSASEFDK